MCMQEVVLCCSLLVFKCLMCKWAPFQQLLLCGGLGSCLCSQLLFYCTSRSISPRFDLDCWMKKTMAGGVSSTARWIGGGRTEDDDGKSFDSRRRGGRGCGWRDWEESYGGGWAPNAKDLKSNASCSSSVNDGCWRRKTCSWARKRWWARAAGFGMRTCASWRPPVAREGRRTSSAGLTPQCSSSISSMELGKKGIAWRRWRPRRKG